MRSSITLGLTLVLLVGLVGCGGDDSSEVADGAATSGAEGEGDPGGGPGMGESGEGGMEGMEGGESDGDDLGSGMEGGMGEGMEEGMDGSEMYSGMEEGMEAGTEEGMGGDESGEGGAGMYPGMGGPGRGRGAGSSQSRQPKTLADMAAQAFQQGRDKMAFQFLFAHAVTADDAPARELLGKMGWIGPPKRPGLAVRWGIGIEFNAGGHEGNIYPIGTNQKMPDKGRGGGRGDGGQGGGGADFGGPGAGMQQGGGGQVNAQLQKYTGELGQMFFEGLKDRLARGDYGEVLKSANAAGTQRQGGGRMGGGGPGMGMAGAGVDSYEGGQEDGFGGGRAGGRRRSDASVTQLAPGALLIGPAPTKELLKLAKEAELDALCVFNVNVVVVRRTQQISTTTKIQVYNVADGKKAYELKKPTLNNIAVQVARANENSRGDDPVDEAMEKVFEHIDGNWRIAQMPTLQQEHALGRIGALLGETHENPLPVLAEIRMYHTQGLIEDNHLLLAYQRKLGNDQLGSTLATGTEEEKKQAVDEWLR